MVKLRRVIQQFKGCHPQMFQKGCTYVWIFDKRIFSRGSYDVVAGNVWGRNISILNSICLEKLHIKSAFPHPVSSIMWQSKLLNSIFSIFVVRHWRWVACNSELSKLGSVAGPVIQANGRLTFEDDLRPGGLLCFTTQWTSVCTGLVDSLVTLGKPWHG